MTVVTKAKGGINDLELYDGRNKTFSRLDSAGGTQTIYKLNDFVDVLQVYGNGSSYTVGTLANAIVNVGTSKVIFHIAPGTWTIDSNITFPSNIELHFHHGAIFNISAGVTVTINGPIVRSRSIIFSGDGTYVLGTVALNSLPMVFHQSVATMKADETIIVGEKIQTLEHTIGYGYSGGNIYLAAVVTAGTDDNGALIKSTGNIKIELYGIFPNGVYVDQFGADKNGSNDAKTAFQACTDYLGLNGVIRLSDNASYLITSGGWTISNNGVKVIGAGLESTTITFSPTANGTLLTIDRGAIVSYGRLAHFTIFSSDATYTKTALDLYSVDNWKFDEVRIGGSVSNGMGSSVWGGPGSIGVRTRGHQVSRFNGFTCFAERPVLLSLNPYVFLHLDHFHFTDCFFIGGMNYPLVEGDLGSGTALRNISEMTFDGYQAWVAGTHGFQWDQLNSTIASTGVSQKWKFANVRWEGGASTSAYAFYCTHDAGVQGVMFDNCHTGNDRNGFYMRGVNMCDFQTHISESSARTNFDVDNVRVLQCRTSLWLGPQGTLANMRLVQKSDQSIGLGGGILGQDFWYETSTVAPKSQTISTDFAYGGILLSLTDTTIYPLSIDNNMIGILEVLNSAPAATRGMGIIGIRGQNQTVVIIADPYAVFSTTKGNANTINVYWDAGNTRFELENQSGGTLRARMVFKGSYIAV